MLTRDQRAGIRARYEQAETAPSEEVAAKGLTFIAEVVELLADVPALCDALEAAEALLERVTKAAIRPYGNRDSLTCRLCSATWFYAHKPTHSFSCPLAAYAEHKERQDAD